MARWLSRALLCALVASPLTARAAAPRCKDGRPIPPELLGRIAEAVRRGDLDERRWRTLSDAFPCDEAPWAPAPEASASPPPSATSPVQAKADVALDDAAAQAAALAGGKAPQKELDDDSHATAEKKGLKDNLRLVGGAGGAGAAQLGFMNSATLSAEPWEAKIKVSAMPSVVPSPNHSLYSVDASVTHDVGEKNYAYLDASWLRNEVVGIAREADARLGFGRSFQDGPRQKIEADASVGYTWDAFLDAARSAAPTPGGYFHYLRHLDARWTFIQNFEAYGDVHDASDWDIRAVTKLSLKLSKRAAAFGEYTLMQLTQPEKGYASADSRAIAGIKLKF